MSTSFRANLDAQYSAIFTERRHSLGGTCCSGQSAVWSKPTLNFLPKKLPSLSIALKEVELKRVQVGRPVVSMPSDDEDPEEDPKEEPEEEPEEKPEEEPEEKPEGEPEEKKKPKGEPEGLTYKDAGVDIDAGSELVRRIAKMAPAIGGFGGLFPRGDSYIVAGTDGVGTKLKLAFETGIHETIGIDLVAMSVNDIVTSGAKPEFFLDYYATGRLDVDLAERVIKGVVDGCQLSGCVLLGGETAEMPGFYADGEYDLSGFAVGIVEKDSVIDGRKSIEAGDVIIGLPSSGVHSNGFSLVRRVLAQSGNSLEDRIPGADITLGEALMVPTVIYVKQVLDLISKGGVKGIAHITGGGFTDNIPRVFPEGLGAMINTNSWPVLPVFKWIQEAGRIEDGEMRRTFNMGIGMVLVVSPEAASRILGDVDGKTPVYRIGEVVRGEGVSYQ